MERVRANTKMGMVQYTSLFWVRHSKAVPEVLQLNTGHNNGISPSVRHKIDIVENEGNNSTLSMEEHTEEVKDFYISLSASWVSGEMTPSLKALLQLPALMKG